MAKITLDAIPVMTEDQAERLKVLLSDEESNNGVSPEESKERTALQLLRGANTYKARVEMTNALINDDIEDTDEEKAIFEKMLANYEKQAIRNYQGYLDRV